MITFSFKPLNKSFLPSTAASVRILVVSWNEAAEINDSVFNDAFVIPSNMYSQVATWPPLAWTASFSFSNNWTSTNSPGNKFVSPASTILTFLVIWRTIISTCLSAISTPWERYTRCTSSTKYCCATSGPHNLITSWGFNEPVVKGWPFLILLPLVPIGFKSIGYLISVLSPSSDSKYNFGKPPASSSSMIRVPSYSAKIAQSFGFLPSSNSSTFGRPWTISPVFCLSYTNVTSISPRNTKEPWATWSIVPGLIK